MNDVSCQDCGLNSTILPSVDGCTDCRQTHRADSEKKLLLNRCSRAEGQIRGIRRMIENDTYCDDVLNQIAATQSALSALSTILLEQHMKSCLIKRIQDNDTAVIDELMNTFKKMMR